jgi:hypothetical protein
MATRHAIPVFTAQDMTISDNFTFKTTTNYGLFLQLSWTGLSGEARFKVQGSNDGSNWSDYPLVDCGVCVYEREILGATDNVGVMIQNWFPDYLRVVYTSNTATAGTINGLLTLIDNQDVN